MSDKVVELMSGYMPNRMPKYIPKSMPEYMSDRMPKMSLYGPHRGLPWWGSLEVKYFFGLSDPSFQQTPTKSWKGS